MNENLTKTLSEDFNEIDARLRIGEINDEIYQKSSSLETLEIERKQLLAFLDNKKAEKKPRKLKPYEEKALAYLKTVHSVYLDRKDIVEETEVSKRYPKAVIQVLRDIVKKNEESGKIEVGSVDINDTIFEPYGVTRVNFKETIKTPSD